MDNYNAQFNECVKNTKDSNGYEERFDSNGNLIYSKDPSGYEEWKEYDSNNNLIYIKGSNGYERWYKYDSNGNLIYTKDSNYREEWFDYDKNGNCVYTKGCDNREEWKEYDNNGNCIHFKNSIGYEEWYGYINDKRIVFNHYDIYKEFISKFNIKDSIKEIIENDPMVKQIYEDKDSCFKNVVIPAIMDSSDNILETIIAMLANQSAIYDKLLNNIAQYGNKELIYKCNKDINDIFIE